MTDSLTFSPSAIVRRWLDSNLPPRKLNLIPAQDLIPGLMQMAHDHGSWGGSGIAAKAITNNVGTRRRRARKIRDWYTVSGSGMTGSKAFEGAEGWVGHGRAGRLGVKVGIDGY